MPTHQEDTSREAGEGDVLTEDQNMSLAKFDQPLPDLDRRDYVHHIYFVAHDGSWSFATPIRTYNAFIVPRRQSMRTPKRNDTPEASSTDDSEDIPVIPKGKARKADEDEDEGDELQEDVEAKPPKGNKRTAAEMMGANNDDDDRWSDPTLEQLGTIICIASNTIVKSTPLSCFCHIREDK
jgi:hypothetical protein